MAETTADVRRDIEMTRERMSTTLQQLEHKMNVMQIVKEHPWPAVALAVGAGFALSGSRADVKAAAATLKATEGTSTRLGGILDDLAATLITGITVAFNERVEQWVSELKQAIGAPSGNGAAGRSRFADGSMGTTGGAGRTGSAASSAPGGSVDRQLLGVDDAAQQSAGHQRLGSDAGTQDATSARSGPPLAH